MSFYFTKVIQKLLMSATLLILSVFVIGYELGGDKLNGLQNDRHATIQGIILKFKRYQNSY